MIVVDSSALIEIAGTAAGPALYGRSARIGTDAHLRRDADPDPDRGVRSRLPDADAHPFGKFGLIVEPVTEERARAAAQAYYRYGKGWHAAALNYSDSFAYAFADEYRCPLLYVGHDFAKTDIRAAL